VSRAIRDALFLFRLFVHTIAHRPRPDLLVIATSPPLVGVVAASAARLRSVGHVHWTMDLYPDVLSAHWNLEGHSPVSRLLDVAGRMQFRTARAVMTLGPAMAARVRRYLPLNAAVHITPVWSEWDVVETEDDRGRAMRSRRGWSPTDLVLMYSGNMGRGHRIQEFLLAAERLGSTGPRWAFAGGGPRAAEVAYFRATHPDARVEVLPYVSRSELFESLRSADVHLVSLSSAWQGVIVPSKLQAAFALGRPVIFVGPEDNEVATWIRASGGGWIVPENDVTSLIEAVQSAARLDERTRRGNAALTYARTHFARASNRARAADILEQCLALPG